MPSIILATTTFCKSKEQINFQCALKTIQEAKKSRYKIIVVDLSPMPEIGEAFRKEGALVYPGIYPEIGSSQREVIRYALNKGAEVIVWLDPEEYTIISLLKPCIEMVTSGKYDMAIPRRKSFNSYPLFKFWSELETNWKMGGITGRPDLDLMIGIRIYNRQAAELTIEHDRVNDNNLEITFIPIIWIIFNGLSIGSKTVDHVHPPELKAAAEQDNPNVIRKRLEWQRELVSAMEIEAKHLNWKSPLA